MIPTSEKLQAVREAFPHIPERDARAVCNLLRIDGDLYRVVSIVVAYIRHAYTKYDRLQNGTFYGSNWKDARSVVAPQIHSIISRWR